MRETLRDPNRIDHMIGAIRNINRFLDGKSLRDLEDDDILFFAVVKNIEILGEAAYKLTKEFIVAHPLTPWDLIIKMRHILVHGYYNVVAEELWHTYTDDLPDLLNQLESYSREFY